MVIPGTNAIDSAFQGLIGPEGFLSNMIDGFEIPAIMIALAYYFYTFQQVRREEWNPHSIVAPIAIVSLISWITFGSADVLIILFAIGTGLYFARDYLPAKPGGSEELTGEEKRTLQQGIGDLAKRMDALEQGIKREEAKADPETRKTLKEIEETARTEHFQTTVAAAEKELATNLVQFIQAERQEIQTEMQSLPMLEKYIGSIEQHLAHKGFGTMEQVDTAGKQVLFPSLRATASITGGLATTERKLTKQRQLFINTLTKDMNQILDLTEKTKEINQHVKKIERKLGNNIGQTTIKKVKTALREKRAKLEALKKEISKAYTLKAGTTEEIQKAYTEQVRALETEIQELQKLLRTLQTMQQQLKATVQAAQQTTGNVNTAIQQVLNAEKPAKQHISQLAKYKNEIDSADKSLQASIKSLKNVINAVRSAEFRESIMAEETIIEASKAISQVFTAIENLQKTDQEMHRTATIPLIDDLLKIMTTSQVLNGHLDKLMGQVYTIGQATVNLTMSAERLVKGAGAQDQEKLTSLDVLYNSIVQEEKMRNQLSQQAYANLTQSKTAIQQHVNSVAQVIQRAEQTEKRIVQVLNKLLNSIVENKKRLNSQFQQQAQQFQQQMAAAQRGQPVAPARPAQRAA